MSVQFPALQHQDPADLPRVFITLLGELEAIVSEGPATWTGCGAGAKQLKRSLAFLIDRVEEPVSKEQLASIAGGRRAENREHVWKGVRAMLRRWGMGDALQVRDYTLILRRHVSWKTDTDQLQELVNAAQQEEQEGRRADAIKLLERAAQLCGGDYLLILSREHEITLQDSVMFWRGVQHRVFHTLAQWHLAIDGRDAAQKAFLSAKKALRFDAVNAETLDTIARAARRIGNQAVAAFYERRAHEIRRRQ